MGRRRCASNGRKQWVYYGNYDWWDMLFREKRPVQQHSVSLSGGTKDIKYLVSGAYDRQAGMQRAFPDIYNKYNLRSKIDFRINKWATLSNNTSFFSSNYNSQGDGGIDNTLRYGSVHALACYPMQNPDGRGLQFALQTYKTANGAIHAQQRARTARASAGATFRILRDWSSRRSRR